MVKGFERYPSNVVDWLAKFETKGWLSNIEKSDQAAFQSALKYQLVSKSVPYTLTKKGRRVQQLRN